ncbi:Hsp70 family protein [Alphaproteobacteria bacterium endosymbiont of Tiliacea citrago]|uniref:Hsp70 family protein n=1 Tax=Alphaproteobacteria bacterium endosymbiont of Tiliacea citrago TaxID=3077944 RepID=UPI00313C8FAF
MIYGIDFGTTYTVVSYFQNEEIKFITFQDSIFLPTENSRIKHLKRVLLKELNQEAFSDNNKILKILVDFFIYIRNQIIYQNNEKDILINCVLTVPIRFNDLNRYFIKYAAISAGFNVIKLIQEPIAAAISVINQNKLKNGKYIVYDLGGGTFDATLIKKHEDIFHVLKVDGLENFGGIDIDKYIAEKLKISEKEAEFLKKTQYFEDLDIVLEKTYKIVEKLLEEKIEAIILTGGSSYLKNIYNYFEKNFKIISSKNLQVLVSEGATLYGENFLNQSQFLIDVTPFNLGIEVLGDKLEVIIPENSPIPVKKTEKFLPINKKTVIKILQGTSIIASECKKLGEFVLESDVEFYVDFILDCDGILTVKVLDKVFAISSVFD